MRKFIDIIAEANPLPHDPEEYPPTLDEEELIAYAMDHDPLGEEIDPEMLESMFEGASASLRWIPLEGLIYNPGVAVAGRQKAYAAMTTTPPPIIVRGKEIVDGNHRVKVARAKGQTHMWAYVLYWDEEPL